MVFSFGSFPQLVTDELLEEDSLLALLEDEETEDDSDEELEDSLEETEDDSEDALDEEEESSLVWANAPVIRLKEIAEASTP